jgi:hypothetical protein
MTFLVLDELATKPLDLISRRRIEIQPFRTTRS